MKRLTLAGDGFPLAGVTVFAGFVACGVEGDFGVDELRPVFAPVAKGMSQSTAIRTMGCRWRRCGTSPRRVLLRREMR